jgi:hypothetical protein
MKTKLLLAGIALAAFTATALGQDAGITVNRRGRNTQAGSYIDANKDGVCDNYTNRKPAGRRACDGTGPHGRGTGRHGAGRGQGTRQGAAFIDENKNGICDTYEARQAK